MTSPAKRLKVIVVDDESPARQLVKRLLVQAEDIDLIGECATGDDAAKVIRHAKPDIVFLDIQMPEMDGFDVLAEVSTTHLPAIIFVTAYDRYAVKAFEAHAVDYLLKPFTRERFFDALNHARLLLRQPDRQQRTRLQRLLRDWERDSAHRYQETDKRILRQRILVKTKGEIVRLELTDILWLESADHYVIAHTLSGKHLLSETLGDIEQSLSPEQFVRIHRGAIVNRRHIRSICPERFGSCSVILTSGVRLRLSRSRRETLKNLLQF